MAKAEEIQELVRMVGHLVHRVAALERVLHASGKLTASIQDHHQKLFETIVQAVCQEFGASREELLGRRRHLPLAVARQMAMALMRQLSVLSSPEIGTLFYRDHGTVLHAVHSVEDAVQTDPRFAAAWGRIQEEVNRQLREEAG